MVVCLDKQDRPGFACSRLQWQFSHYCIFHRIESTYTSSKLDATSITTKTSSEEVTQQESYSRPRPTLPPTTTVKIPLSTPPWLRRTRSLAMTTPRAFATVSHSKWQWEGVTSHVYATVTSDETTTTTTSTTAAGAAAAAAAAAADLQVSQQQFELSPLVNTSLNCLVAILCILSLILVSITLRKNRRFFVEMEVLRQWNARNIELQRL